MKNFKEIAEKCLKGELFGVFKLLNGSYVASQFLCQSALYNEYYFLDPKYIGRRYDQYGLCMHSEQFHIVDFIPNFDKSNINMKQERNVKLTLEKAKEWYKKGGELKEVALQAFDEKELNDSKPRSWKEYCELETGFDGAGIDWNCGGVQTTGLHHRGKAIVPTNLAAPFIAMMQLMSLRQVWIGDWKPDWTGVRPYKYCITGCGNDFYIHYLYVLRRPLSFPTQEMAVDFMDCFKDLLEIAKPLI